MVERLVSAAPRLSARQLARLLMKVETAPAPAGAPVEGDCWLYTGYVHGATGYAMSKLGRHQPTSAHRIMFEHVHGRQPRGHDIDHLCRVRRCVNPRHLDSLPHRGNVQRVGDRGGTSRFRGVYRAGRRWRAQIHLGGRCYHLGTFDREEDAAEAARTARLERMEYAYD